MRMTITHDRCEPAGRTRIGASFTGATGRIPTMPPVVAIDPVVFPRSARPEDRAP
jgi:hypothetical protein